MAIKYKFDILQALKNTGFNTNRIRKEKLFSESTLQKFRSGEMVHTSNIDTICRLLNCQPGDILEYTEET